MAQLVGLDNNFIYIRTPFEHRDFVKNTLNGNYLKSKKAYRFPKNLHCLRELGRTYPVLLQQPKFVETGKRLSTARDGALQLKTASDALGDERLRPYQRADVQYLNHLPSAGIFNEPRTGKTPTSIILMKKLGTRANLVISPASLIWNWAKEFEIWWPRIHVLVYAGTPKQREKIWQQFLYLDAKKVLIISKDTWKREEDLHKLEFDTCFVDEAHFLRNYKTDQSKAIFKAKAKRRYALTGTPTVKGPDDIFGILHFLYPEKFPSYWQFAERYCYIQPDEMGHMNVGSVRPEREVELQELIGFASVQRKRQEVMPWLPKKQYQTIPVVMDGKQWKLYERMREEFMAYFEKDEDEDEHFIDTPNILSQLMRLRQLCIDPRLVGFDIAGGKTKAVLEWLDDNREPIVIMSMFTSYLKLIKPEIEKLGLRVGMIHGEMDNKSKNQAAREFQAGTCDVLLCNTISAGVGFTLDRSELLVFIDKPWNPSDQQQAEDRITPTTQDRIHNHNIITFTCVDSIDQRIDSILEQKRALTDIINEGGKEAIRRLLE